MTDPACHHAVELARARNPAVILMNVNFPGMSGIEALRCLKADPATRPIPVIALSAAALERDRQRGIAAGFRRYLTKPIDVDALIDVLEPLLGGAT